MNLRPFQRTFVDALHPVMHERPIGVLPTGGGKTYSAGQLILERDCRTLWLAHRRELIRQAVQSIARLNISVGAIMSGLNAHPRAQVQVASVQTLARRDKPQADLIVVDECHHARAKTYGGILEAYPGVPVLGLTATPFRLDGKGLGDVFGRIVVGAYPDDLCNDGTLVEPVVYAPDVPDMSHAHHAGGDYRMDDVAAEMRKPKIVGDVVDTWKRRAYGKRTILFAPTVAVSKEYVAAFKAERIPIEHLDGSTPTARREAILHRLAIGYTLIVSNVGIVEEGFDLPALDCAIVTRPTESLCWHLQSIGRIMRSAEGKGGAIVLDHAGNHLRHGPVTQRLEYDLGDAIAGRGKGEKASPLKRCPACFLVVPTGARICPGCEYEFKGREIRRADGELVLFDPSAAPAKPRASLAEQQQAWDAIDAQRKAREFREGWSYFRFEERFGFRPLIHNGTVCDPQSCGEPVKVSVYERLLNDARARGHKDGAAAIKYKAIFGVWPRNRRVG